MIRGYLHTGFDNAEEAFESLYQHISDNGRIQNNTKAIYDVGFYIFNPMDKEINTPWRKWNKDYADAEWQWYLSKDRNATEISKRAPIWKTMMDENGNVQSNYGWQWNRNNQIDKVIEMLKKDPTTRRASISIYDGKEIDEYTKDTPCTYSINFSIADNQLNMSVLMRSNDLVFGFCNDQYCFANLQEMVSREIPFACVGTYYHFSQNMHIYDRHYNMKKDYESSNNIGI
jgi:thymidylate synthase